MLLDAERVFERDGVVREGPLVCVGTGMMRDSGQAVLYVGLGLCISLTGLLQATVATLLQTEGTVEVRGLDAATPVASRGYINTHKQLDSSQAHKQ